MQLEPANPHRFCVAPMLDWTTPECRALHRLFSRHAFLYSEMVTSGALIFGDVPPLNYPLVYEVKRRFPELTIIINGGITTLAECRAHLQAVDGVMLGRAAYQNPELLLAVDELYGAPARTLAEVLPAIRSLLVEALGRGEMLAHYTRHLLGLFPGVRGAKQYRRILSEEARAAEAGIAVFDRALAAVGMAG